MVWTLRGNEQWKQKEWASFACLSSVFLCLEMNISFSRACKSTLFVWGVARTLQDTSPLHNSSPTLGVSEESFRSWEKTVEWDSDWRELFEWQEYGWMLECQPGPVTMTSRSFVARFSRILKAPGAIGRLQVLSIVRSNSHWNHSYFSFWLP